MIENYVNFPDGRLWSTATGTGVPLVLCNGGPGCGDYLAPVAQLIDDIAQVIRYEQRGCGRSSATPAYDVPTFIDDLEAIRQAYHVEQWVVGGHSWGAELALAYARQYPNRTSGILCIAGGRINNDREWHKVYRHGRDAGLERLPTFDYPANMEVNAQVNASWKQYIQDPNLLRDFSNLKIPALFLYGEADIRPSWPVAQLANLMPNGRFQSIPGAQHYIWLTHAKQLKRYLRDFIAAF